MSIISAIGYWVSRRKEQRHHATKEDQSVVGVWSNSEGFSMAPTNGSVIFRADGTGEMVICAGPEEEFLWQELDDGMFELWEIEDPSYRYPLRLHVENLRGWFVLHPEDVYQLNSEIVIALTSQEWIRVSS